MKLIDFINCNKDWKISLKETPFYLNIKEEYPYYLLKYNMGLSNFELEEVKEARGLIVRENFGRFVEVAHGLDKFFNADEPFAANIDWKHQVSVLEKIDGTNIRFWFDSGKWHISTLGVITADNNEFGTMVQKFFQFHFDSYVKNLDPNFTYVYELVAPTNRIVVHYDKLQLYFIEKRNIHTGCEYLSAPEALNMGVVTIPAYTITTVFALYEALEKLGNEHEGFVVCDENFNRIKVKTTWYLELHKIRGNGICTIKRVIKMWKDGSLDDFLGAYPEYTNFVDKIMNIIKNLIRECETQLYFNWCTGIEKKEFAERIKNLPPIIKSYCFVCFNKKIDSATNYVRDYLFTNTLVDWVEDKCEIKEFGIKEDE